MYSFLVSGFALTLILYPLSPAGAGLILTFILTTSLFFRSSYFAHISVSPPCFFLLLIIFLNVIQWTLDPDRFSQDWTIRLKSMQGYFYLALMMLTVPLVRKGHYKTTDPDRFAIFFLLTGIPAIYSIAYIFSLLASKGGRASFLIEHNFEIAFLNIIISLRALALRFNAFPSCLMWPKGTNMWFQGVFNSVATRSLSGSLGLALVMIAHKNLTRSVFTHTLNLQTLFIALKSKIFARLMFLGFLLLASVGLAIIALRGGGAGIDRLSYVSSLGYLDLPDLVFGMGVSSVLPPDMSSTLLLQENLKSQLDSSGYATSLLLHSAWLRVLVDTGLCGLLVVTWSLISLFNGFPVGFSLMILGPVFATGLSVGSIFNPISSFALFIAVCFISQFPVKAFKDPVLPQKTPPKR